MIVITKSTKLSFREMKKPFNLVNAARTVTKNGSSYGIARTEQDAAEVLLISKAQLDGLVANVDPSKSLPVKTKVLDINVVAAGERAEEMYRLILAQSNFPGNSDYSEALDNQAFEKKINATGTQLDNQTENKTTTGSAVTATFPIASLASVSARSTGGPVTVVSVPNLSLGVVNLDDGGPIANGTAIELVYQTKEQLIVNLLDQNKKVIGCMVSKEFYDNLLANAL